MINPRPVRAPLAVIHHADGVELHDPHTGSRHHLNVVAHQIWELCDGSRDRETVVRSIAIRFAIPEVQARSDVAMVMAQFHEAGLIGTGAATAREHDLLLWAVGSALGTRDGPIPGGLSGVRWNALVQLAVEHGVMPLLHRCASSHWGVDVPPIVRERLDSLYAGNQRAVDASCAELVAVVHDLSAAGIAALPLKGPVLAHWLHGSAAMRQVGDLDVFVPREHASEARAVLVRRGYTFRSERQTDALAVRQVGDDDVWIDLQWALARGVFRFPLSLEAIWPRLDYVDLHGTAIARPRREDYLLLLCAHANKHCWSSLAWIADIACLVDRHGQAIDWERLLRRSTRTGGERQLLLGLRLARTLVGIQLPAPVIERLRASPSLDPLVAQVRQQLFARAHRRTFQGSFGLIRGGIFYMRTRERVRDRLPYAAHLVKAFLMTLVERLRPNEHDRAVVNLPDACGFLYYAVRLVRVTLFPLLRPAGRSRPVQSTAPRG